MYSGVTGYDFLLGVLKSKFIARYCTRHNYNTIQINAITAGAEVALIPPVLSLFKMQCRDQIKKGRPALKGQTAESKAISESRAGVRQFPGVSATI